MREKDILYPEQASFKLGAADKGFAHFDERSDNENPHPDGFWAIQGRGGHNRTVFCEDMR